MADKPMLPPEWNVQTINSLGRVLTGKTPLTKIADNFGGHIPFITPSDMDGRRIIAHTARYLTEQGAESVSSTRIPKGTVMVSCIGSDMGKAAIAGCDAVTNQQINSIIIGEGISNLYVYYNLSMRKSEIQHIGSGGSAVPILNKGHFSQLQIALPPLKEQQAIAHILGTLDDKIELNRRMNETLEEMACALFKSWFVTFDPVRAKAAGRDPGLPKHLADLFPDSFEDSELGEIPKGWTAGSFAEVISQRTERLGGREAVVLSAVAEGKLVRSDEHFTKRVYSKEINKYLVVEQWDFAYNPSRINIGSIGMLKDPLLGAVSPVYLVLRPRAAYRWFLEFSLERASTKQWINTLASGSVRQSLSYIDFSSIPCVVPPEPVIQRFNSLWSCLLDGILSRSDESHTLAAIRDTLLPKLISGELRIQNAERFISEVIT